MPAFLTSIAAKLIGAAVIAAAIAGLLLYIHSLRSDVAAAEAKNAVIQSALDQANQVNADNLVTLTEIKARHAAELKVVTAERDAAAARVQIKTVIRERVIYAASQPNGDGPLAPALKLAIDSLRRAGADAGPAGQDPGRATVNPGLSPGPGAGAAGP